MQSELHVADCGMRVEPVPSRHQTTFRGRFKTGMSATSASDAEDGQPQHHDIGTPPPTTDEGDNKRQFLSWEGPRTGVGSVVGGSFPESPRVEDKVRGLAVTASARANCLLSGLVREFAERHVFRVDPGACNANARNSATLPLALGGVGLRSSHK